LAEEAMEERERIEAELAEQQADYDA